MRGGAIACTCALVLGGGQALADAGHPAFPGSELRIAVRGPVAQGTPFTIVASGTNVQNTQVGGQYELNVFVQNPREISSCGADYGAEQDHWTSSPAGVDFVTGARIVREGSGGPFNIEIPVLLHFHGPALICAYTIYVGLGDDAASAFTQITVKPRSGSATGTSTRPAAGTKAGGRATDGRPGDIAPPTVTRVGRRLLCTPGSWSGKPRSYRYRWVVVHTSGTAGVGGTLQVTAGMHRRQVRCSVTATNSRGGTTATSPPFTVR